MSRNLERFQLTAWPSWGGWTEHVLHRPDPDGNLCSMEIEVETDSVGVSEARGILSETPGNRWEAIHEGSLRGTGFEVKLAEPLPMPELLSALSQLHPLLLGVHDTFRGAVHYHGNIQGWTRKDLARLAVAYYILEPCVYEWIGKGRDESNFCVPWSNGNEHVHSVLDAYHAGKASDFSEALVQAPKYSGLNLAATTVYGSVEFRHMQTPAGTPTQVIKELSEYAYLCAAIMSLPKMTPFALRGSWRAHT